MRGIITAAVLIAVVGLSSGCNPTEPPSRSAGETETEHATVDSASTTEEAGVHRPQEPVAHHHEEKTDAGHEDAHQAEHAQPLRVGGNQMCPVMPDEKVDPSLYVEYEGKRIYVCCKKCRKRVSEDPAAWYAKISGD